jgi:hypothetical protein
MRGVHRAILCLLALALGACRHAYRPPPDLEHGATAVVQILTTENVGMLGWYPDVFDFRDRCPGTWSGGATDEAYLGQLDLERNHDAIQLKVRAPSNIFFHISLAVPMQTCGVFAGFRSEPDHLYRAVFSSGQGQCRIEIADITDGSPLPVPILQANQCGPTPGEQEAALGATAQR